MHTSFYIITHTCPQPPLQPCVTVVARAPSSCPCRGLCECGWFRSGVCCVCVCVVGALLQCGVPTRVCFHGIACVFIYVPDAPSFRFLLLAPPSLLHAPTLNGTRGQTKSYGGLYGGVWHFRGCSTIIPGLCIRCCLFTRGLHSVPLPVGFTDNLILAYYLKTLVACVYGLIVKMSGNLD